MKPIFKRTAIVVLVSLGLTACGSTLHEKIMEGGTITLADFKDGYQTASDNSKLKNLKITDSSALAKLQDLAKKLNNEEKKLANNKAINQCNHIIAKAKDEIGELNYFYRQNKEKVDIVRKQQADNTLMTGMATFLCAASDDCQEELAENGVAGVKEIHSVMNEKIIEDNNARGVMTQYAKLEKKASAAQQKINACQAKTQQIQAPYFQLGEQLFATCVIENWFDLSKDANKKSACGQLVETRAYKTYLK